MSDRTYATAVVQLHAVPDDRLRAWADRVTDAAATLPGFRSVRLAVTGGGLRPAIAATFDTAAQVIAWLDSDVLDARNAEGVRRAASDVVIADGHRLPPGTAIYRHDVIDGRAGEFVGAQRDLVASTARFPGHTGTVLLAPAAGAGGDGWMSVVGFRTDGQLATWSGSDERGRRLTRLRALLTRDFDTLAVDAPFGTILRIDHGRPLVTPGWKTAMLVLLVLYPTVMLLSRFLGPVLQGLGAQPWLSMWLSQIVSIAAMTYVLMPAATRLLSRWLDPLDGASARVSIAGAVTVAAGYAATLWLFSGVRWLDFWTHG